MSASDTVVVDALVEKMQLSGRDASPASLAIEDDLASHEISEHEELMNNIHQCTDAKIFKLGNQPLDLCESGSGASASGQAPTQSGASASEQAPTQTGASASEQAPA